MSDAANHTRGALLNAAERLFSSRGYAAVGIREIADQAGANVASISYHFGSKHDLYLATVRRAMSRHAGEEAVEMLADPGQSREAAAVQLVRFIRLFFVTIAERPEMEPCGLLLLREALHPSEAIEAVVRDYLQPRTRDLVGLIHVIMPDATPAELRRYSELLFGQLLYYRVFRPFIERLGNLDLSDPDTAGEIGERIAVFTLRGLGFGEEFITRALADGAEAGLTPSGGTEQ